jgi:hypothetical protein
MKLPFKIYDLLIALVLAIPVGGFLYGFSTPTATFAQRLTWGIVGIVGFMQGGVTVPLADKSTRWFIVLAFFGVLGACRLFRFYSGLRFPHKRRITIGFATAITALLLVVALMPTPEDSALVPLPATFRNGASFEVQLNVPKHRIYYVDLQFNYRNGEERKIAMELVGGPYPGCVWTNTCGIVTEVGLTVRSSEDQSISDRVQTLPGRYGHYAHGSGSYTRNLGNLPLEPGRYIVTVTAINVDERIHSSRVDLLLHPDPRGSSIRE